jgi:hypothetical protein
VSDASASGVPKNCVTHALSSASSLSRSLVRAMARGFPPTVTVPADVMLAVSMTLTVPSPKLVTYARVPDGESATPVGSAPTAARVAEMAGVSVLMPVTFTSCLLRRSTTNAVVSSG